MRENHHDIQTTKKEPLPLSSNRKPKPISNTPSKKLNHQHQKSIKRNLTSAFTLITEDDDVSTPSEKESIQQISPISDSVDVHQSTAEINKTSLNSDHDPVSENAVVLPHPEQSIGVSAVSEAFVSNGDQFIESLESYIASASKQLISPASTTSDLVESTPSSSSSPSSLLITVEDAAAFFGSVVPHDGATTELNSFKVESVVNDLRGSMCQVLNSDDLQPKYTKIFDTLAKMVIELHSLHEVKDLMIVLLSFVLAAIVGGSVGFLMFSDAQSSYFGPPPT